MDLVFIFTFVELGPDILECDASWYVPVIARGQVFKEVAWRMGFISDEQLYILSSKLFKSGYGEYLQTILNESKKSFGSKNIKI